MRKQGPVANQRLIEARLEKCWSQEQAASECGVGERSYRRWESGESYPSLASLRLLKEGFGRPAADLGYEHLTRLEPVIEEEEATSQRASVVVTLTTEQVATLSSLLQGGRMDKTRRKTLQTILNALGAATTATQLFADTEPWERIITGRTTNIDTATLDHFEGLAKSCAGLINGGQMEVAEQVLAGFLPHLIGMAPHSQIVASLASGCLQQKSVLVSHRLKISEKVALCQRAVTLAQLSRDHNRLTASLAELGVAFQYANKPDEALDAYQKALHYTDTVSPLLQSRVYMETSDALARLGRKREAEFYLDLGHEAFPEYPEQDPSFAFADYGPFTLALYHGLTHLNMGLSSQAWDIFNTYLQNPKNSAPERIRILIINHQGRAAIHCGDREKYASCLEEGLAGAVALKSKKRFDEANTIFQQEMPVSWLRESPIKQIMERYGLDHRNTNA